MRKKLKQLMDTLEETRGYWELKEEVLDCTLRRTCYGMNEYKYGMNGYK